MAQGAPAPFRRGPFEELPERPARSHIYYDTEVMTVRLRSRPCGDMRAHVRRHGSGPPLLLVHGLMTSSYSFRYVLAPLGAHFTVYAPDLPGAGRSDRPTEVPYTAPALAEWLGELQGVLGLRGCAVLGNSMGGYLAMQLALRDGGAMSRLVNLHSPGLPEARLYALSSLLALPGMERLLLRLVRRDPLRWAHRNVHYYDESLKSLEEAREYGEPLADPAGARAFARYLREALSPYEMRRFRDALASRRRAGTPFPVPLLLVYAEQDPMVPPRMGPALAALVPEARLVWLREASHFAHVDAPGRLVEAVLGFLRGAADGDRGG
jgi:pimeloyl-ACP methyl ester carboxylesterase